MLLSWNNVAFYQALMAGIRAAISTGTFQAFKTQTLARFEDGRRGRDRADGPGDGPVR